MANHKDVEEIVAKMSAAFPNWQINAFTIQVYFDDLKDIPGETLKLAADMCRTEAGRKFAPSTGELRGAVMEIESRISNVPDSYQAWEEVRRGFGLFGHNSRPEWSHPLIEEAVNRLGWRVLCMSEDQISDRSRFIACYDQLRQRAEKEMMLLPAVRGYIELKGGNLLESPMSALKQLADKLSVK